MKRTLIATAVAATLLLGGCSTLSNGPAQQTSLRFDYQATNREATGLIRAFDDREHTILQFIDLAAANPAIYDAEGRKLDYSRVGQYAVLPGLYPKVTVRVGGQAAEVNTTRPDETEAVPAANPLPDAALRRELEEARTELARTQEELERVKAELAAVRGKPDAARDARISAELDKIEARIAGVAATIYRVRFGFAQADFTLSEEAKATLLPAARAARLINVRGRTDSAVADEANERIARARAEAARAFLIANGVEASRIRTYAQAAGGFVAPNNTEEGRAKNRRVEIELIGVRPSTVAAPATKAGREG